MSIQQSYYIIQAQSLKQRDLPCATSSALSGLSH